MTSTDQGHEDKTIKHPSLTTDVIAIPDLNPKRQMALNEPCWCLSRKPWGKCHKDREKGQRRQKNAFVHDLRKIKVKQYCSHPNAPDGCRKIIKAHTIQRRGGLTALQENGHVCHLTVIEQEIDIRKVGVYSASTFHGFCDAHDAAMFSPIEKTIPASDKKTFFLFSFRAVAFALFAKQNARHNIEILRTIDQGLNLEGQALFQKNMILPRQIGTERSLNEIQSLKLRYDAAYRNDDLDGFHSYACHFSEILPVAYCGIFHPEVDMCGNLLQRIAHGTDPNDLLAICLTPLHGKTLLILTWFGNPSGPSGQFAQSFRSLTDTRKANAAIHLGFETLDNIFFDPAWWRTLPTDATKALKDRRLSGTEEGPDIRQDGLSNLEPVFSTALLSSEHWM